MAEKELFSLKPCCSKELYENKPIKPPPPPPQQHQGVKSVEKSTSATSLLPSSSLSLSLKSTKSDRPTTRSSSCKIINNNNSKLPLSLSASSSVTSHDVEHNRKSRLAKKCTISQSKVVCSQEEMISSALAAQSQSQSLSKLQQHHPLLCEFQHEIRKYRNNTNNRNMCKTRMQTIVDKCRTRNFFYSILGVNNLLVQRKYLCIFCLVDNANIRHLINHLREEHPRFVYDLERKANTHVVIIAMSLMFYHPKTLAPIFNVDQNMEDSDDDTTEEKQRAAYLINEFVDVNEGEKGIFKLWNSHMFAHRYEFVGAIEMPNAVIKFVENYRQEILQKNLYYNLVLFLNFLHLFDYFDNVFIMLAAEYVQGKPVIDQLKERAEMIREARIATIMGNAKTQQQQQQESIEAIINDNERGGGGEEEEEEEEEEEGEEDENEIENAKDKDGEDNDNDENEMKDKKKNDCNKDSITDSVVVNETGVENQLWASIEMKMWKQFYGSNWKEKYAEIGTKHNVNSSNGGSGDDDHGHFDHNSSTNSLTTTISAVTTTTCHHHHPITQTGSSSSSVAMSCDTMLVNNNTKDKMKMNKKNKLVIGGTSTFANVTAKHNYTFPVMKLNQITKKEQEQGNLSSSLSSVMLQDVSIEVDKMKRFKDDDEKEEEDDGHDDDDDSSKMNQLTCQNSTTSTEPMMTLSNEDKSKKVKIVTLASVSSSSSSSQMSPPVMHGHSLRSLQEKKVEEVHQDHHIDHDHDEHKQSHHHRLRSPAKLQQQQSLHKNTSPFIFYRQGKGFNKPAKLPIVYRPTAATSTAVSTTVSSIGTKNSSNHDVPSIIVEGRSVGEKNLPTKNVSVVASSSSGSANNFTIDSEENDKNNNVGNKREIKIDKIKNEQQKIRKSAQTKETIQQISTAERTMTRGYCQQKIRQCRVKKEPNCDCCK